MTEKQRSDAGLPYFPGDEELRALRARCKQLCYAFNTTEHQQREERINLLRQLLGSTNGRFLLSRASGAITATTSIWAKIFTPTTTASSSTAPRSPLATT